MTSSLIPSLASEGLRLTSLPDLTLRGPAQRFAVVKEAWSAVARTVATKTGLELPEPTWVEAADCAVHSRGVRLARIQLDRDSVEGIAEAVMSKVHLLLSLGDTARLLEALAARAPVYGREMERLQVPPTYVYSVLRLLLRERVSVADLETILSALLEGWRPAVAPEQALEKVREALREALSQSYGGERQELAAITLAPRLESGLRGKLAEPTLGLQFELDGDSGGKLLDGLNELLLSLEGEGTVVLITAPDLRLALFRLVEVNFPRMPVLSWNEVSNDCEVVPVGLLEMKL